MATTNGAPPYPCGQAQTPARPTGEWADLFWEVKFAWWPTTITRTIRDYEIEGLLGKSHRTTPMPADISPIQLDANGWRGWVWLQWYCRRGAYVLHIRPDPFLKKVVKLNYKIAYHGPDNGLAGLIRFTWHRVRNTWAKHQTR